MKVPFSKYHGTGNDFIMIDNRDGRIALNHHETFEAWCHRRYGVGADGIIFIELAEDVDFKMVYFNANGYEGSMCGNGGRCAVHFARSLGIINTQTKFLAVDGLHEAKVEGYIVELKMCKVDDVESLGADYFVDTGSPHHVEFVEDLAAIDTYTLGKAIRNNERYVREGTNVNFAEIINDAACKVSTYERGVEDLTLSCGTGVTAVAIAALEKRGADAGAYEISTENEGGTLAVRLEKLADSSYDNIWLKGPAVVAFTGELNLPQ